MEKAWIRMICSEAGDLKITGTAKNIRRFTRKFMKTPVGKKHPQDVFDNSDLYCRRAQNPN